MVVPVLGLLVSTRDLRDLGRTLALFCLVAGAIVTAYFLIFFGSPLPTSMTAYLEQTFQRSRGHIAVLQVVFGLVPFALATAGAVIAWRNGRRILALTCLLALGVYPAFHLWTANFVSGQKHVVPGFLFGYLLAGVALERLWRAGSRVTIGILLAFMTVWGGVQWYWQEHSWSDTRPLTSRLVQEMKRGERSHRGLLLDLHLGALSRGADRISGRRDRCELFAAARSPGRLPDHVAGWEPRHGRERSRWHGAVRPSPGAVLGVAALLLRHESAAARCVHDGGHVVPPAALIIAGASAPRCGRAARPAARPIARRGRPSTRPHR